MADFWLPPDFLTEDDILMDFKPQTRTLNREIDSVFDFSSGFNSFNSDSGLSSPDESTMSSESEEEYLAGLTRKMASSTLLDDLWKTEAQKKQAQLLAVRKAAEWDFLYAATQEIVRKKRKEEADAYYRNMELYPNSYPMEPNHNFGFHLNRSVSYQQLQLAKFQQMKREQLMKQHQAMALEAQSLAFQYQNPLNQQLARPKTIDREAPNLSPMSWPTLQQSHQQTSGTRAFPFANTGSKRECAGTGVFLPRRTSDGVFEPGKKLGCPTVFLPNRVVQSLNLNLEAIDDHACLNNALTMDFDATVTMRNNQRNLRSQSSVVDTDLRLPQEWTY